jgi:hypothetical protein
MSENRFNQILILDSIPSGELNTAKRLREDMDVYASAYKRKRELNIKYVRTDNRNDFVCELIHSQGRAWADGVIPLLHIECHGDEDGLELADGSGMSWGDLYPLLRELNIATRFNLLIAVSACCGAATMRTANATKPAPFWGLIGPTKNMYPDELERAFGALYLALLRTKSSKESMAAMDEAQKNGDWIRTTAMKVFQDIWRGYKKYHCTPEALHDRSAAILNAPANAGRNLTVEQVEVLIRQREQDLLHRYWKDFFMHDLFPECQARFPLSDSAQLPV